MNSDDYYSKLDVIVNDSSKFKKLEIADDSAKASLIISKQRSVKYYVDTYLNDKNGFDKKLRASLTSIVVSLASCMVYAKFINTAIQ